MIRVKDGVTPHNLYIAAAAANAALDLGIVVTITSGTDGKHMTGSKHYIGDALDFRTRDLSAAAVLDLIAALKERLGLDYKVLHEVDHIHVEFSPLVHLTH